MKHSLILILGVLSTSAMADTLYKCTDKGSDSVLFTNQRVNGKSCTVISLCTGNMTGISGGKVKASATPTPSDFPKVSNDTQKERDGSRRTILDQELASEQRNLDEARKAGNTNKAQLHERNITALQKEIANLK